jgi:hypothetical protein
MLNVPRENAAMAEHQMAPSASPRPSRSLNIYLVLA